MTPQRMYERFCKEFPGMKNQVVKYYRTKPRDTDYAIRITCKTGKALLFGVNKDDTWKLVLA